MLNHSIIFYGPFGGKKKKHIGGGESGNNRTKSVLRKLGYSVISCEKPYPIKSSLGVLLYPFQLLLAYFHLFYLALKTSSPKSIHVSGFYNFLIYIEFLIVCTSRLLGIRVVYEARAGGMIESYKEKGRLYRIVFNYTMKNASAVLCQGKEYVPFIQQFTTRPVYYYPNYVLDQYFQHYQDSGRQSADIIELVYFGRIAPSKNIEFIVEVAKELKSRNQNFYLELIGAGKNDYLEELRSLIDFSGLSSNISFSNATTSSDLFAKLLHKHFFVFPTREKREGHSNALTEAMSFGVVPIVSSQGFNETVVGDNYLVIGDFIAKKYSDKVVEITKQNQWAHYSKVVYERVEECFTEHAISGVLKMAHSGSSV